MDEFDFANMINDAFGLPPNDTTSSEEKVGQERLGSGNVGQSFGATLLLGTVIFTFIILVVLLAI